MRHFDRHVVVDWSSRAVPSPERPSRDAIWAGVAGEAPRYFRTRAAVMDWLGTWLGQERAAGRRVLVGFDFPFGYPRGFAAALTGRAEARAVWAHLADAVEDGPQNGNNRFAVAAEINRGFRGAGPFWGRPAGQAQEGLGTTRSDFAGLPEHRLTELAARGPKSCWQLSGAGSVGGQVLTGLPALHRLHAALGEDCAVWPFEGGFAVPEARVVLAEVYPSLLAEAVKRTQDEIADRAQVRLLAEALAGLDARDGLGALFAAPDLGAAELEAAAREEGWILGVGHEAALRGAAHEQALRAADRLDVPALRDDCFALPPGVDWVPMEAALARLRERLACVVETEVVPLTAAAGRVLAAPVSARRAHPPAANSAVDGYGFAQAGLGEAPHVLPLVAGRAAAGVPFARSVPEGYAVRVLTGAALPQGIDTVVLDEDVAAEAGTVRFGRGLRRGANVRAAGEDVAAGAEVLAAGARLAPQDLALAAAVGLGELPVRRALRVAVLSTGDELRAPGEPVAAHQIHDANRPMLLAMLRGWGMAAVDLDQAADTAEAVAASLDRGATEADAILTTGGASAGDEDHVAALLRRRGTLNVWRIAIKPGRPLALGTWSGKPVFGLPGNPVAAFVCALIFARPALGVMAGRPWESPRGVMLPAAFAKKKKPGRREYLRARLNREGAVEVFASEGSGRVSGLVWARGLVELGDEARTVSPGDPVRYLAFSEFGV